MTTPTPFSELGKVEWKKCDWCEGTGKINMGSHGKFKCRQCEGTGNEPVLVENPLVECNKKCRTEIVNDIEEEYHLHNKYQLRIGEIFKLPFNEKIQIGQVTALFGGVKKFLPLRPVAEGDNSVMMVVKV